MEELFDNVKQLIENIYLQSGIRLDERLTGYRIDDAVRVDINPAIGAIVRTELLMKERLVLDLRELVNIVPPMDTENLFVTFQALSAQFRGENAENFGMHVARMPVTAEIREFFHQGLFVPGVEVHDAYHLITFLESSGKINLAKTGLVIALDKEGRLVSYAAFQIESDLTVGQLGSPSRLNGADQQIVLYVFLTLTAFMSVNQGEAPLRWLEGGTAIIG